MSIIRKIAAFILPLLIFGCASVSASTPAAPYGVLIGADPEDMGNLPRYQTAVIDAAYYSKADIDALHKQGSKVYTYLNIGSVETFREIYPEFKSMTLAPYEDWPGEFWMDVSRREWLQYLMTAAKDLTDKDVDGFFLDNADVYYQYPTDDIFNGLVAIVNGLSQYGKDIIINGGDVFVCKAALDAETPLISITGVNQECVFTAIDFDNDTLSRQELETTEYYAEYLARCKESDMAVYLTEYANPAQTKTRRDIEAICKENGYVCYIASSIQLDGKDA